MVRAALAHFVIRDAEQLAGGQLLKGGLPVETSAEPRSVLNEIVEQSVHQAGGNLQPTVDVNGTDEGFEAIGQDRRFIAAAGGFFAATEPEELAEPECPAHVGECPHVDHGGPQLCQLALGEIGVGPVQGLSDDHAENGVTQKLEALVGRQTTVLIRKGTMRQRAFEKVVIEAHAGNPLEMLKRPLNVRHSRPRDVVISSRRPGDGCKCRSSDTPRAATSAAGTRGCCTPPAWERRSSTWRGGCVYCSATFSASEPARLTLLVVGGALAFGHGHMRAQSGPSRVDLVVPVLRADLLEPRPALR